LRTQPICSLTVIFRSGQCCDRTIRREGRNFPPLPRRLVLCPRCTHRNSTDRPFLQRTWNLIPSATQLQYSSKALAQIWFHVQEIEEIFLSIYISLYISQIWPCFPKKLLASVMQVRNRSISLLNKSNDQYLPNYSTYFSFCICEIRNIVFSIYCVKNQN
jgi:hypothetical protein